MNVEIATTESEFSALRPEWESCARGVPTQSWNWLHAWWSIYASGKPLRIAVCREAGTVIGILPFYLDRVGPLTTLRLLGSGHVCSDYAGPLSREGRESDVIRAFFEFLANDPSREAREMRSATLQLDGIFARESWIDEWDRCAEASEYRSRRRELESAWRVALPDRLDDVAPLVHKHVRRKFKKALSRIRSQEVQVRVAEEADIPQALQTLERLHTLRQRRKGNPGCFADPRFGEFLNLAIPRLAAESRIQLVECLSEDKVFATKLQLLGANCVWMYQCGSDPDFERLEPGHLLITASLGCSIDKGYRAFDFMRGNELYKAQWGAVAQPLCRLTYVPNRVLPLVADSTVKWLRIVRGWTRSNLPAPKPAPADSASSESAASISTEVIAESTL